MRKAARESLERIGRPFREDIPELSAALKDPNATVRIFALQTLLGMDLDVKTAAPLLRGAPERREPGHASGGGASPGEGRSKGS